MGLCRWLTIVRFVLDGIPPLNDPALSIEDTFFEGVSVRIYQPKEPSSGQRKGIVYIHGGCGIFGSVGKNVSPHPPPPTRPHFQEGKSLY